MPCKLILRNRDKVPRNHPDYHRLFQEGDIIDVVPDTWAIGRLDLLNPDYTIVQCDMEPLEARQHFLAPEPGDPVLNPNLRRRAAGINKAIASPDLVARMNSNVAIPRRDGDRERTYPEVMADFVALKGFAQVPNADLLQARQVKPAVGNPFVVGQDPFTVG